MMRSLRFLAALLAAGLVASASLAQAQGEAGEVDEAEDEFIEEEPLIIEVENPFDLDDEGDDPESPRRAFDLTVEEAEALLDTPDTARLGREADEDLQNPTNILAQEAVRRNFLGEDPAFVYFPRGIDPLIVPWVRNRIVAGELLGDATEMLRRAQEMNDKAMAQRALEVAEEILEKYSETDEATRARVVARDARAFIQRPIRPEGEQQIAEPVLPPQQQENPFPRWVRDNTVGVIVDRDSPDQSRVLVGDFILRPGERIARFPTVRVKEVFAQKVIYEFEGDEVVIEVAGQ